MAESSNSNVIPPKIVSAQVISVIERPKEKSKYSFEVRVKWSDDNESVCHRGYSEFFKFHCELLDSFPQEAGAVKGSTRILPFLPGKNLFRRNTKSLAEERLPQLDQYASKLVALPDKISCSFFVMNFFRDDWNEEAMRNFVASKDTANKSQNARVEDLVTSLEDITLSGDGTVTYSPSVKNKGHSSTVPPPDSGGGTSVPNELPSDETTRGEAEPKTKEQLLLSNGNTDAVYNEGPSSEEEQIVVEPNGQMGVTELEMEEEEGQTNETTKPFEEEDNSTTGDNRNSNEITQQEDEEKSTNQVDNTLETGNTKSPAEEDTSSAQEPVSEQQQEEEEKENKPSVSMQDKQQPDEQSPETLDEQLIN